MPIPVPILLGSACLLYLLCQGDTPAESALALPPPPEPEPEPEPELEEDSRLARINQLLDDLISTKPVPGSLYTPTMFETFPAVIRRALDSMGPSTEGMRLDYAHNVASGTFNLGRYGTPSTSKSYPASYLVPGIRQGIRVAFQPRNQDAVTLMRCGVMPRKVVHPITGAPQSEHRSLGTVWLPPVCRVSFERGVISCAPFSWEDGSSTIDPDPELLALLEGGTDG